MYAYLLSIFIASCKMLLRPALYYSSSVIWSSGNRYCFNRRRAYDVDFKPVWVLRCYAARDDILSLLCIKWNSYFDCQQSHNLQPFLSKAAAYYDDIIKSPMTLYFVGPTPCGFARHVVETERWAVYLKYAPRITYMGENVPWGIKLP